MASFLIDREGVVQHQVVNNLSLRKNVEEMIRMIDAPQQYERGAKSARGTGRMVKKP